MTATIHNLPPYLRALVPACSSHAHAARLEAWAADVERVVAELAELHAMASAHNPTPPSPEVRAEHERRLAEILERIGPEKAWANLTEGIHARSRLSPDGRAEFDALWDRWDDERDPHEKAKLQMQLAEWCASLVSHGESADRECAELSAAYRDLAAWTLFDEGEQMHDEECPACGGDDADCMCPTKRFLEVLAALPGAAAVSGKGQKR